MPTLNWIGKEAVVNHHQLVPFHLLKDVPDLACGEPHLVLPQVDSRPPDALRGQGELKYAN